MTPSIIIPEYIIHSSLELAIKYLREDFTSSLNPTDSFLYKLVGGVKFQKYNYFEQAQSIFITELGNPRHITLDLMYNATSDQMPSIYISTPADSTDKNGIGMDEGYQPSELSQDGQVMQSVFTRRFSGVYDIVITSDNSNEIVLMYHILKSLLISLYFHFNASGLQNVIISGNDLTPYSELVPKNCFQRIIRLKCEYEAHSIGFEKNRIPIGVTFSGRPVDEL